MAYLIDIQANGGAVRAFVSALNTAYVAQTPDGGARVVTLAPADDWTDTGRGFAAFVAAITALDGNVNAEILTVDLVDGRIADIRADQIVSISPQIADVAGLPTQVTRVNFASPDTAILTTIAWGPNGATALAFFDPPPS